MQNAEISNHPVHLDPRVHLFCYHTVRVLHVRLFPERGCFVTVHPAFRFAEAVSFAFYNILTKSCIYVVIK